uniref:CalR n=1 Tax=uncultured Candidatus Entotheonella sp. TaxID=312019 RepID=A0A068PC03_9BACT|nr:CalR [uncultured Candidatus Entotheonella sp.]
MVDLSEIEPGIVLLQMQDRIHKNAFTDDMTLALLNAFDTIAHHDRYKVVVLTGFDSYFSTGGDQASLLRLHEGRGHFATTNLYSLALNCRIPVISAMQGHGIGGGFVIGLFADVVILSRESVYTTNFMRYGFTPGMGATYIVPLKLGTALGHEMLFLARNYRGEELKQRGAPFTVLPRAEVLPEAMKMSRQLAEKPRVSLMTLKDHLVADQRRKLPDIIRSEVAMHEQTFHQDEVKQNILSLFGK